MWRGQVVKRWSAALTHVVWEGQHSRSISTTQHNNTEHTAPSLHDGVLNAPLPCVAEVDGLTRVLQEVKAAGESGQVVEVVNGDWPRLLIDGPQPPPLSSYTPSASMRVDWQKALDELHQLDIANGEEAEEGKRLIGSAEEEGEAEEAEVSGERRDGGVVTAVEWVDCAAPPSTLNEAEVRLGWKTKRSKASAHWSLSNADSARLLSTQEMAEGEEETQAGQSKRSGGGRRREEGGGEEGKDEADEWIVVDPQDEEERRQQKKEGLRRARNSKAKEAETRRKGGTETNSSPPLNTSAQRSSSQHSLLPSLVHCLSRPPPLTPFLVASALLSVYSRWSGCE